MQFSSPDTLVPDQYNPLDWNRYAYARYNPVKYTDPTGHWVDAVVDGIFIGADIYDIQQNGLNWENGLALTADIVGAAIPIATGLGLGVRALFKAGKAADRVADTTKIINKADDVIDVVAHSDNLSDATKTSSDLFAFGGSPNGPNPGPRNPRADRDLFPDEFGMVGPEKPPLPNGASTFSDPAQSGLTGHYYMLPAGTQLPDGIRVVADGKTVIPSSPHPATHHTIYPSGRMSFDLFSTSFRNLPWKYAGKQ